MKDILIFRLITIAPKPENRGVGLPVFRFTSFPGYHLKVGDSRDDLAANHFDGCYLVDVGHAEDEMLDAEAGERLGMVHRLGQLVVLAVVRAGVTCPHPPRCFLSPPAPGRSDPPRRRVHRFCAVFAVFRKAPRGVAPHPEWAWLWLASPPAYFL